MSSIRALVIVFFAAASVQAVTIDMVTVGNPGNAADTRYDLTGFGSVGYNYQIGKYEVTAGQYTEFLNAVAKADPRDFTTRICSIRSGANPANWFITQFQLLGTRRRSQPTGELRRLLGRGPVCQLASQRPANWSARPLNN